MECLRIVYQNRINKNVLAVCFGNEENFVHSDSGVLSTSNMNNSASWKFSDDISVWSTLVCLPTYLLACIFGANLSVMFEILNEYFEIYYPSIFLRYVCVSN